MSQGAFFCLFLNSSKHDNFCTCVVVIAAGGGIYFTLLQFFLPSVHPRICERSTVFPGCSAFRSHIESPSARDQISAPSCTASLTTAFYWACIICALPCRFCMHYASTHSKAGTPTLATSCVYGSPPPCRNGPRHRFLS
jgi:hypothetical protein